MFTCSMCGRAIVFGALFCLCFDRLAAQSAPQDCRVELCDGAIVATIDDDQEREANIPTRVVIVAAVSGVPDRMPPGDWQTAMALPPRGPQSRVHLMDPTDHGWLARHV
jgi:hypothetical protein